MTLFSRDKDYAKFEQVLLEAQQKHPMRLLSYCLMPNHWHLTLWPKEDGDLSRFMFWMTMTHVQRWRHFRGLVGLGPLYQGRFKAFPIESDSHLLTVNRYVERNALRANLVDKAELWQWSSLHQRHTGMTVNRPALTPWPVKEPADWVDWVNLPQTDTELAEIQSCLKSGRPFSTPSWKHRNAKRLGIIEPGRPGRPRKR